MRPECTPQRQPRSALCQLCPACHTVPRETQEASALPGRGEVEGEEAGALRRTARPLATGLSGWGQGRVK